MIQFLKPRSTRRRSQRHLDVVEPAPMPLPDVTDWLAKNAEPAGLTAEEAAEIQFAFQRQVDDLTDPSPLVALTDSADTLPILAAAPVEILALVPTSQLVDAAALVEFRLETCSSGLAIVPPMVEPAEVERVEVERVEAELVAPVLTEAITAVPAADVDREMAIDDLLEEALLEDVVEDTVEAPIDWVNPNWASEAVDVAAIAASASEVEVDEIDPLTYFQYYSDENAIGGQGTADEVPAAYVTPWRQPSIPGGLIGAGVLGATLVSGFVIADTVKTSPVTAVKRPTSPLQSLSAKDQAMTAAALPKVMPPESMKPEVALPKPKSMTMIRPVFPPLVPLGQSIAMSPLGSAIARSDASNPLPQSNANSPTGLALNPPPPVIRTAPAPVAGPVVTPTENDRPTSPTLPDPVVVPSPSPQLTPPPFTPAPSPQDLPELMPDVIVSPPPEVTAAPISSPEVTAVPISSPLQRLPTAPPAQNPATLPPVDVVVPTLPVVVPAVIAPAAATTPSVDSAEAIEPADREFTRDAAPAVLPGKAAVATPMPPVATAQPIADRSRRLPASVQNLLAVPAVNAYVPMVSQWRPLSAAEANAAINAPQLGGYTRQQLSQQAYVQAYQAVSQSADGVPSFGFIDYQRKLIILPPGLETVSNSADYSRSADGEVMLAQRTMSL
jgi:hypothetical protein